MRGHYNQTYQGKPSRGDKVFSTGRFIQGILDIRVTQKIDTNSTVWYVHSRVVVCSLLLFNDLVLTDSENRNVCSFLVCTVDKASKHQCSISIHSFDLVRSFGPVQGQIRMYDQYASTVAMVKIMTFILTLNIDLTFQFTTSL